ncbi:MAG: YraN family protein [candidate division WOR-3 bacterium]
MGGKGSQDATSDLGKRGEEIAACYLKKLGYEILGRNLRFQGGEIDIVARHRDVLVFVEVKARRSADFAPPIESVRQKKQKRLRWLAECYLAEHPDLPDSEIRFDVVSVVLPGRAPTVEHVINAF